MAIQVKMKSILAAAVGLFLFVVPVKADECVTVDSFSSAFAKEGVSLLGSTAAATKKLGAVFNANREANGQPKTSISIFLLGLIRGPDGVPQILAAVVDGDGCVIKRSVVVMPIRYWVMFMEKSGVKIDDFIPLDGA